MEELLNELPENRPLYKDSGLWQIWDDDMKEVLYQQICDESLNDFIVRCSTLENMLNNV